MSRLSATHLNHANSRRLLQAVGSSPAAEASVQATKYDWHSPRYFSEEQYNRLAAVMSQIAAVIAAGLGRYFNREMTVSPASIAQHFAGSLQDLGIAQSRYYLTFGADQDKASGFLSITAETALKWVTHLLGDSGSAAGTNRALSSLEESLLIDVVTAVADAFLSALQAHAQLCPGDHLLKDNPSVPFEPAQEICMIVFSITGGESDEKDEVLFLLPCELLALLVGKGRQAIQQVSPDESSRTLLEHVQQMPVTIVGRLACTTLDFGELLGLEEEDIFLLDKPLDEPVELLVDNRVLFRGHIARSATRRAVVVTQSMLNPAQKTTKMAAR
ncbi:MAG: FliM/FliN family flagellar motor switch protein [Sedimentisphaerales bacterium]|nr:FliM/FliN family flagellar motor switch protein [Sedimentisphaerales bacterium]